MSIGKTLTKIFIGLDLLTYFLNMHTPSKSALLFSFLCVILEKKNETDAWSLSETAFSK